jgi:uncharacterized protein YgfB (UPF0149 family)
VEGLSDPRAHHPQHHRLGAVAGGAHGKEWQKLAREADARAAALAGAGPAELRTTFNATSIHFPGYEYTRACRTCRAA